MELRRLLTVWPRQINLACPKGGSLNRSAILAACREVHPRQNRKVGRLLTASPHVSYEIKAQSMLQLHMSDLRSCPAEVGWAQLAFHKGPHFVWEPMDASQCCEPGARLLGKRQTQVAFTPCPCLDVSPLNLWGEKGRQRLASF